MIYVGTSGYSYKEWKGSFYPEKISAKDMLAYYASRFAGGGAEQYFLSIAAAEHGGELEVAGA